MIFYQNKNENDKKAKKAIKSILYSELAQMTCDVTCSKTYRNGENIGDKKLSVEHTPIANLSFKSS